MSVVAFGNVFDSLGSGFDLVRIPVWNLNRELFLDSHDDLNGVERIQVEIIVEVGLEGDL